MSLELITPVNDVFRRDVELADPLLADPTSSTPLALEQGEWLARDASGKLERVGATARPGAMQMFTPKGDFSAQAIGKVTVLQLHEYEAETDIYEDATIVGGVAVNDYLTARDGLVDGDTRSCLAPAVQGHATNGWVYAIVTKVPAQAGDKLRYQKVASFLWV
jgi:hypothetical protein